ncbi:MAG: TIGR03792 family protein [Eubacteriales bacterium]|nr:TIGR03792 family protein [Eubacteriales bacterium]
MKNSQNMIYTSGQSLPVEVLRFQTDPQDVEAFLKADHEVWTVMECDAPGFAQSPFIYKEVWLNDRKPGEITVVILWKSQEAWDQVGDAELQARLTALFDERFGRPYQFVGTLSGDNLHGIHCISRFEEKHEIRKAVPVS